MRHVRYSPACKLRRYLLRLPHGLKRAPKVHSNIPFPARLSWCVPSIQFFTGLCLERPSSSMRKLTIGIQYSNYGHSSMRRCWAGCACGWSFRLVARQLMAAICAQPLY
eukprot:5106543-Pleurochrysis_carterae.AAC.1